MFGSTYVLPVHLQMGLGLSASNVGTNPERLSAFNESFFMLAALCAVAVLAAWQLREVTKLSCGY